MIDFILAQGRTILLLMLIGLSIGILIYLFGNRKRGQRIESYRNIPFVDERRDKPGNNKYESGDD
jgi:cbb3-type cytochrome oxidase subunit 3